MNDDFGLDSNLTRLTVEYPIEAVAARLRIPDETNLNF